MDIGNLLVGVAAVVSALVALITVVSNKRQEPIKKLHAEITEIKGDLSVIKEASFFGLQGHVEKGVNGDVRKAYERLKKILFPE